MFEKILIANRGEIACRIIETAHRMGIATVAIYSDADADARHVSMSDEAWHIGPAPAKESYLKTELILDIAKKSGAQAIHPGYGFVSENAAFAQLCEKNDIVFIGPPASAIEAMGSKSSAKEIMEKAGVPLVQGYHGENQDADYLKSQAFAIGYPVLIKATAGGGGKGMRIVENHDEFDEALLSCQREAKASFNDDKVLIEKYLTKPRHVEIQVFADSHDGALHLFERDCSVQRRHQKVIEEAPAPGLTKTQRSAMGKVAVTAATAIGYVGAGTVEFLLDEDGSFYFMEMNTRLQVEHPVTEKITGQDLVAWQLLVANGAYLPCSQQDLTINGHSIEVRIYAEDPDNDFLPATGSLEFLSTPKTNEHVRIDTGIRQGDQVSVHYDPMIAKLIVWDKDRAAALNRLRGALNDYQIVGVKTNLDFLRQLAAHSGFNRADLDTHFIERYQDELFSEKAEVNEQVLSVAALYIMLKQKASGQRKVADTADPFSPWDTVAGWRLNEDNHHKVTLIDTETSVENPVVVHFRDDQFLIELANTKSLGSGQLNKNAMRINLAGEQFSATVIEQGHQLTLFVKGNTYQLLVKQEGLDDQDDQPTNQLTAPMPGTVVSIAVSAGDKVESGQPLLVMEAMKMEHTIKAPADGVVAELLFEEGDLVDDGAELVIFEAV